MKKEDFRRRLSQLKVKGLFEENLAAKGISPDKFYERVESHVFVFSTAITSAFEWRTTPQGQEFWAKVAAEINPFQKIAEKQIELDTRDKRLTAIVVGSLTILAFIITGLVSCAQSLKATDTLAVEVITCKQYGFSYSIPPTPSNPWADTTVYESGTYENDLGGYHRVYKVTLNDCLTGDLESPLFIRTYVPRGTYTDFPLFDLNGVLVDLPKKGHTYIKNRKQFIQQ